MSGLGMGGMGSFLDMSQISHPNVRPYGSSFLTLPEMAPGVARPLNLQAQSFGSGFHGMGGMGAHLPASQGAYLTENELRNTPGQPWQGPWLSVNQVKPAFREPLSRVVGHPQAFGGMGQPVPVQDLRRGEYLPAGRMLRHTQAFGGVGQGGVMGMLKNPWVLLIGAAAFYYFVLKPK